jgi:hypothetical protein
MVHEPDRNCASNFESGASRAQKLGGAMRVPQH